MKKKQLATALSLSLAAVALVMGLLWSYWHERFARSAIAGVAAGEVRSFCESVLAEGTKADAEALLGAPLRASTAAPDQSGGSAERWRYSRGGWQCVNIYFDAAGRVLRVVVEE